VLGYRKDGRPIFPIAGGAPDDDIDTDMDGGDDDADKDGDGGKDGEHDEDDDDESDDDESDDDEDDDAKLGEKGEKALRAERDKNKALRKELRELRKKGKGEPDAEEKAAQAAEAKWKPVFVREKASAALREAGLIGKPNRLLKLLDIDALDVDIDEDDGSVDIDGLDDQIAELRKDYPSLFRSKRGGGAIDAGDRDADRLRNGGKAKSATELQAAALLGRSR
jgi:hypothetical protein